MSRDGVVESSPTLLRGSFHFRSVLVDHLYTIVARLTAVWNGIAATFQQRNDTKWGQRVFIALSTQTPLQCKTFFWHLERLWEAA